MKIKLQVGDRFITKNNRLVTIVPGKPDLDEFDLASDYKIEYMDQGFKFGYYFNGRTHGPEEASFRCFPTKLHNLFLCS